jgi:cyanophycinase
MIKNLILLLVLIFTGELIFAQSKGHLVIIGGGKRPDYMMKEIIRLAGGEDSKIVVIPNASSEPEETASYQVNQLKELGAKNSDYILCNRTNADSEENLNKLKEASGIFFSGGDQSRLTSDFLGTKFLESIHQIYNNGGVISGTSAGAAVMSEVMITGNELLNKDSSSAFITIETNNIETVEGFGFIKDAIIDQHFIMRKRLNRLLSLVIENPTLLGIGIDEATAIKVKPDNTFEVMGESQVIVFDAFNSSSTNANENGKLGIVYLTTHILLPGQSYDISNRKVLK